MNGVQLSADLIKDKKHFIHSFEGSDLFWNFCSYIRLFLRKNKTALYEAFISVCGYEQLLRIFLRSFFSTRFHYLLFSFFLFFVRSQDN